MDLSHLKTIAHPGSSRRLLETNVVSHAIDVTGRPVVDPSSGRGVAVAHDLQGNACAKISNHWPPAKGDQQALIAQGAFFNESGDARFRGVWIELPRALPWLKPLHPFDSEADPADPSASKKKPGRKAAAKA